MDNAGAVIGPLVAAGLLALQVALRQLIAWSLVPGVVCTILALSLRDPPAPPQVSAQVEAPQPGRWQFSALTPALQRTLPVVALFTLANSSNLFLLLRARQLGVPQPQIPLLWAAISAVAMVGSTPLAAWSDRIGRRRLLVAGYGGYGLFYGLIGQLQASGPWLLPLFASYGLFLSATEGVEKALVADLSTAGRRGTAFGWLYEGFSPRIAFTAGGICALAAAVGLARLPLAPDAGPPLSP